MTGRREEKGVWEQRAKGGEEDPIQRLFSETQEPSPQPGPTWARLNSLGGWASSAGSTPAAARSWFHWPLGSGRPCPEFSEKLEL